MEALPGHGGADGSACHREWRGCTTCRPTGRRGGKEMIDLSQTIDLSTTYLGLKLKNPVVASASPLSESVHNVRRLEDAGAAAVVLHSLFEEQVELESDELDTFLRQGEEISPEAASHFPELMFPVMAP